MLSINSGIINNNCIIQSLNRQKPQQQEVLPYHPIAQPLGSSITEMHVKHLLLIHTIQPLSDFTEMSTAIMKQPHSKNHGNAVYTLQ